jgi:diaminohydroxyphosphoribosylaminopyrimidine deaminase/5-amino-6-(5-phosphoribosylamino)uracil reductase
MTPPCADALIAAGVARVVIAAGDPDPRVSGRGVALLRAAGVAVTEGVEADAARRHHAGHLARVALGRPHVTLKMAVSSDGKAGLSDARVPITGAAANARMHMVRAMSDAIAVGVETARVDDPLLTVRLPGLASRSPIRVVFDPELRLPTDARLVQGAREVATHVLAAFGASPERAAALADRGVVLHSVPPPWLGRRGINLVVALRELAKLGITRLLLEGGPRLAGAFLAADLVDEAIVLQAPHAIGADGVPALGPGPLDALGAGGFELVEETALGVDRMLAYARRR